MEQMLSSELVTERRFGVGEVKVEWFCETINQEQKNRGETMACKTPAAVEFCVEESFCIPAPTCLAGHLPTQRDR
jgi:hypothetical protein